MADGRIIIDTLLDPHGLEDGLKDIGSIAKTGLKAFTGLVAGAGTAIAGLGTIGVKYNAEMEQYMSSFTTMLGSAEKATTHLNELKEFAAKTPFELGDLAKASTTLQAFGTDAKDITPTLKMLGDISLGNKEKFNGLALVFGQVQSQGKLMGQDLMQMINNGFNPLQIISEKTGKSMSQLKDEMSKGQISFEMVADAMKTATSEGGKFYNAMEGQSKTLVGQWSTLKDNAKSLLGDMFTSVSDTLTNTVLPKVNEVIEKLREAFTNGELKESINKIAEGFGNLATKLAELIVDWLPKIIEGFAWVLDHSSEIAAGITGMGVALMTLNVANMIMGLVKAFREAKEVTEGLTVAQWLYNEAMAAFGGPIGLVVAAIAGLVAGIVVLWNTNEGFRNTVTSAWNSILAVGQSVWGWLVNFFTVDIPNAFQAVINFFTGIPAWFSNLWLEIQQAFIDGWNAITEFFTVTIPAWIDQIFNWFNELPYKIGYALGYALGTIVKWGTDTWDYLVTNVPIWIENVVKFFSELPGKLWTWLVEAFNKVVEWGRQIHDDMVAATINAINAVVNWFATLPSRIWTWLSNTISKIIDFKNDLGVKATEAGSNMVTNLVNSVKDLPSKFIDIGKNIVKGVWDGITGMGKWLADKVSDFFGGIVNGAKDALGIHSPSRVMRDLIGKNLVRGIGVGIDVETPKLKKSLSKNLLDAVSSFNVDELSAKMTATVYQEQAKTSRAMTEGHSSGSQSYTTIDTGSNKIEATIKVPVYLEGKQIAEASAPYSDTISGKRLTLNNRGVVL